MCAVQLHLRLSSVFCFTNAVLHTFCLSYVLAIVYTIFWNNMYVSSKNEGTDLIEIVQLFDFYFISNCLKGLNKVKNWKL